MNGNRSPKTGKRRSCHMRPTEEWNVVRTPLPRLPKNSPPVAPRTRPIPADRAEPHYRIRRNLTHASHDLHGCRSRIRCKIHTGQTAMCQQPSTEAELSRPRSPDYPSPRRLRFRLYSISPGRPRSEAALAKAETAIPSASAVLPSFPDCTSSLRFTISCSCPYRTCNLLN